MPDFDFPVLDIFTPFYGKGDVHRAEGGDRVSVSRRILSNAKQRVKDLERLPAQFSQREVEHEAGLAAEREAALDMLKEVVKHRKRQLQIAAQEYALTSDYQSEVQTTVHKLAQTDNAFAKKLAKHGLVMGVEEAETSGYQQAHRSARTLVEWN